MKKDLSSKAMLVSLSISVWTARRFDKKVTGEVASAHNTSEKAGRFNKNLLPIDAPSYKAVQQSASAARQSHYEQTLPWSDEGSRILPALNYTAYTDKLRAHHQEFNNAVYDFCSQYPALRTEALRVLNGLGNVADYPQASELPSYFAFDTKILPFPSSDDFRVSLHDSDVQSIKLEIERNANDALAYAMKDPFRRLHEAVARMTERLSDPDAIFRDSLVDNLRDLCDVLPRLNLTNDPSLDDIRQKISQALIVSPQSLRDDKRQRESIALKAKQIENELSFLMK